MMTFGRIWCEMWRSVEVWRWASIVRSGVVSGGVIGAQFHQMSQSTLSILDTILSWS